MLAVSAAKGQHFTPTADVAALSRDFPPNAIKFQSAFDRRGRYGLRRRV